MSDAVSTRDIKALPAQPGRELAAARESCGLSVADIARQLKLSPWQIEALETDNYVRLPGAVFVRGFIRNYARLVKLDPARLLVQVERQLPAKTSPAPELPPSADIPFPSGREFKWQKLAIAALVLLVPVVIFEFYRDDATAVAVNPGQVALPQPPVVAAEPAVETNAAPQVSAVKSAPAVASVARAEKTAPEKAPPMARRASVDHQPGEHRVRLRFTRESWVEIRDGGGRKIFSQLNPAGTEQAVSGQPPLTLVVGNAAGVRLTHNDQPVNLAPHTKIDVARLTLE